MTHRPHRSRTLHVALLSLSSLLASQGLAQSSTEKLTPKPVTPVPSQPATGEPKAPATAPKKIESKPEVKTPAQPEHQMTPEEQKMMEAATPGPMHEILKKGVGNWNGTLKSYSPDGKVTESTCHTMVISILDGRYTQLKTMGEMMGMKFEGYGVYGYNNTTKQFEASWIDNMSTCVMPMTGTYDEAKKQLTWTGKYVDPVDNKPKTMREVDTFVDADHCTMEMWIPGPDGKEYKCAEISNTRVAGKTPGGAPVPGGSPGLKKIPSIKPAPTPETKPEPRPESKPDPKPEPR